MERGEARVYGRDWVESLLPCTHDGDPLALRLARMAGPGHEALRHQIERCLAGHPDDPVADLVRRLRSFEDSTCRGAVGELLLAGALRELGFGVTLHPVVGAFSPDLEIREIRGHLTGPELPGREFGSSEVSPHLVEVVTVGGGASAVASPADALVVDALRGLRSRHALEILGQDGVTAVTSLESFRRRVGRQLEELDQGVRLEELEGGLDDEGEGEGEGEGPENERGDVRERWARDRGPGAEGAWRDPGPGWFLFRGGSWEVRYRLEPEAFARPRPAGNAAGAHRAEEVPTGRAVRAALRSKRAGYPFDHVIGLVMTHGVYRGHETLEAVLLEEEAGPGLPPEPANRPVLAARFGVMDVDRGLELELRLYPDPASPDPGLASFFHPIPAARIRHDRRGRPTGFQVPRPGEIRVRP